jgi:hypothetical protein
MPLTLSLRRNWKVEIRFFFVLAYVATIRHRLQIAIVTIEFYKKGLSPLSPKNVGGRKTKGAKGETLVGTFALHHFHILPDPKFGKRAKMKLAEVRAKSESSIF